MTDPRSTELAERLAEVQSSIEQARAAAGRGDDDPTELVVVTKFHPLEDVCRLAELGVRRFGENRAQEASQKKTDLAARAPDLASDVQWNMIGHIQSKKAASVAGWADRVHSVDSIRVADGLNRGRQRAMDAHECDEVLPVLLQLSVDGDVSRGGVTADEVLGLADHVAGLSHVRLAGLMVIPPLEGDPAEHFEYAAGVRDRLRTHHPEAGEFSAGMTADIAPAVAAGSTCVRVGTAILGPRPVP